MTVAVIDMLNQPLISRNTIVTGTVSATRRGLWLVLGWLAFWFGTVVYPCQAHYAPPANLDAAIPIEVVSGLHVGCLRCDSHPAHEDGMCQGLTAPAIGVPFTAAVATGNPNIDLPAPAAFDMRRPTHEVRALSTYPAFQPPPRAPLYLRQQRLLI